MILTTAARAHLHGNGCQPKVEHGTWNTWQRGQRGPSIYSVLDQGGTWNVEQSVTKHCASATKAYSILIELLTTQRARPLPLRKTPCVKAVATGQGVGMAKKAREILSPLQIGSDLLEANAAGLIESGQDSRKFVDRRLRSEPRRRGRIVVVVQKHDRRTEHETEA